MPLRFKTPGETSKKVPEKPSEENLSKKYGKGLKMLQKMGGFQVG